MKIWISLIFASALFIQMPVQSWWDVGHMTVSQIAYDQLEPGVKEKADEIITYLAPLNPRTPEFITAACYADDMVDEGMGIFWSWHGSAYPYDMDGVLSRQESKELYDQLRDNDAIYAIKQAIKTLKNPEASQFAKSFMLRFLLHVVGDIHQPLHCTTLYSKDFKNGDTAGTKFKIKGFDNLASLHSLWDSIFDLGKERLERPLTSEGLAKIQNLAADFQSKYPKEMFPDLEEMNPLRWREESHELGEVYAYDGVTPFEEPSQEYQNRCRIIASKQITLAGYRLAILLNDILK